MSVIRSVYLAPDGLEQTLETWLQRREAVLIAWHGRLALSPDPPLDCPWSQDTWTTPIEQAAPSIKAAADALRARQRNWSSYSAGHHRRMALIEARLPPVKAAPLVFATPAPIAHLGGWAQLAPARLPNRA